MTAEGRTLVKLGIRPLLAQLSSDNGGWTPLDRPLTRDGSNAFLLSVTGNVASDLDRGMKFKVTQTSAVKYFNVASVGSNTFSLIQSADYELTTSAMSDAYYSYFENAVGFPEWFNYSASPAGFSAVPASPSYRFKIRGKEVVINNHEPNAGTSNSATFTHLAPVPAANIPNAAWRGAILRGTDNNVALSAVGAAYLASNTNTITLYANVPTVGWTASNGKRACYTINYEW